MKIVIVNAHSFHNLGDAAILQTMVDSLCQEFPSCEIVVCSDTPEKDQTAYKDVRVLGIDYPWLKVPSYLKRLVSIFFHIRFWLNIFLHKSGFKKVVPLQHDALLLIDEIASADLVVSCGGGYINSLGKLFTRISHIYAGIIFGKPTVLYSQSVSDLRSFWHRWLVAFVINRCDLFVAREKQTLEYLHFLGVSDEKVRLHADSAFLQGFVKKGVGEDLLADVAPLAKRKIGMTITRWSFPGHDNPEQLFKHYIDSIHRLTSVVISELDCDLYIFPQVTGPNRYSDDRVTAKEIFSQFDTERIHLLEKEYSPEQLKGMIACMDLFVGTRMHSNIFALGAQVPTLAIAYQEKTIGIMRELGLERWVLDINTIDSNSLVVKIVALWEDRDNIALKLHKLIPEIVQSARMPAQLCREIYERKR